MGVAIAAAVAGAAAAAGGAYLSASNKPKIPKWKPMDIGGEVSSAIAANEANFGRSAALTEKANVFNQEQVMAMMRKAIPNFDEIISKASKEYASGIEGKLSDNAVKQIRLENASWSQKQGVAGSRFADARELRNYGLNVEAKIQNSLNSFQSWSRNMAALFQPGMTSIAESFIPPRDWIKQKQSDKENAWRVSMGQAIQDAQPSGGEAALASGLGSLSSASSMYAGYKFANRPSKAPSTAYGAKNQVFDEYGNWNV